MTKKLQELLSERSVESQKRIQRLAETLVLSLPAHTMRGDLKSDKKEIDGANTKKPSY